MKSYGRLWEQITAPGNLAAAWARVRQGHTNSAAVQAFARELESHLGRLRDALLAGDWCPGTYRQFRVQDPKPRTIRCAPVCDRVLHHALCGVITPLLERGFSEDSYACREGKGTHRACLRARHLVRRNPWYCKIDVRHYFDSMDDMILFAASKAAIWEGLDRAARWLRAERGLELKAEATRLAPVSEGVPFLGLRIFPSCWRLQRGRFLRTRRKLRRRERDVEAGLLDEAQLQVCAVSAHGGVRWFGFRNILRMHADRAAGEGAASGSNRVKRGGSWNNNAQNCRSANRNNNTPSNRNNNIGCRVASTVPPGQAGSHPAPPVSRVGGNEHARPRTASSLDDRRAGALYGQGRGNHADEP